MEFWQIVLGLAEELSEWKEWELSEPYYLLLLFLLPLTLLRPVRVRLMLRHGDPWLFKPRAPTWFVEFCIRYLGLAISLAAITCLFLSIAYPVKVEVVSEFVQDPPRVHVVVDASGSVSCQPYAEMQSFMTSLVGEKGEKSSVAMGLYFFSGRNLLHMYPTTNSSRIRRLIKRFGPKCSLGNINGDSPTGYGAGMATEPGPSLWDAVLDAVRHSDPTLLSILKSIQDRNGLEMPGALPLPQYFGEKRDSILFDLRQSVKGSRIIFITDLDFGSTVGKITVQRVLELMSMIELRIDVVSIAPDSMATITPFIKAIRGEMYYITGEKSRKDITVLAEKIRSDVLRKSPLPRQESYKIVDEKPRFLLLVATAIFAGFWVILRVIRPIIGW